MKKFFAKVITIITLVVAGGLFLKFSSFDFFSIFKEQPIVIEKTANVVDEVRSLAEYTTAAYYNDIVVKKSKEATILGIRVNDDELVLITKGKVRAGFDLSKLKEEDIVFDSVSVTLKLPKVQILDVITNPSDFETFEESGKWSHEEVTEYKNNVRLILENNTINDGILELAEKAAQRNLTYFLQALGFETVTIILTEPIS